MKFVFVNIILAAAKKNMDDFEVPLHPENANYSIVDLANIGNQELCTLDLGLPITLLQRCCQLQAEEVIETMGIKSCDNVADAVQMWAQRRDNAVNFFIKGMKSSPVSQLDDRWHCHISSVDILEESHSSDVALLTTAPTPNQCSTIATQTEELQIILPAENSELDDRLTRDICRKRVETAPSISRLRKSRRLAQHQQVASPNCESHLDEQRIKEEGKATPVCDRLVLSTKGPLQLDTDEQTDYPEVLIKEENANETEKSRNVKKRVLAPVYQMQGTGTHKVKVKRYVNRLPQGLRCHICLRRYRGGYATLKRHVVSTHSADYRLYRRVEVTLGLTVTERAGGRGGKPDPLPLEEAQETLEGWRRELHGGPPSGGTRGSSDEESSKAEDAAGRTRRRQSERRKQPTRGHTATRAPRRRLAKPEKTAATDDVDIEKLIALNKQMVDELPEAKIGVTEGEGSGASVHEGDLEDDHQTYVCVICRKKLSYRRTFLRHLLVRHSMSPQQYLDLLSAASSEERNERISRLEEQFLQNKYAKVDKIKGEDDGRRLFPCPSCPAVLTEPNYLMVHIKKIHCKAANFPDLLLRADDYICQIHRKDIVNPETLTLTCHYCGVSRVGRSVVRHLRNCHEWEEGLETVIRETDETYKQLMKEREADRKRRLNHTFQEVGRSFPCRFCEKPFKHRSAKSRHETFSCKMNVDRQKSFWCRTCGKHNASREALEAHCADCGGKERQFMCHICGKTYANKSAVYIHKKVKHDDVEGSSKSHKCPVCDKSFYQRHHYKRHLAVHSEDRSCQCELCGKRFKTADAVAKHQRSMHRNKYPYHCEACGHGVSKQSYLQNHQCGRVRRIQDADAPPEDDEPGHPAASRLDVTSAILSVAPAPLCAAPPGVQREAAGLVATGGEKEHYDHVPQDAVSQELVHLHPQLPGSQLQQIVHAHQLPMMVAPGSMTDLGGTVETLDAVTSATSTSLTSLPLAAVPAQDLTTISMNGALFAQPPTGELSQHAPPVGMTVQTLTAPVEGGSTSYTLIPVPMYMPDDYGGPQ